MKRLSVIIFLVLAVIFVFSGFGGSSKCDQDTWRLVAEVYAVAISYPNDLPGFIEDNSDNYIPGGRWQECAELLASQLTISALFSASPSESEEEAMSIATRAGAPELGPKVAESMMETATDMVRLASWLSSISNSVPEIQKGNLTAYQNTEPYLLMTTIWGQTQSLLGTEYTRNIQRMTYEANVWIVLQFSRQIK